MDENVKHGVLLPLFLMFFILGCSKIPDYEKYKAGGYRESVPCERHSRLVCGLIQLEYKEKGQ